MRVCFYTLGCKVNQNETGALAQLFEQNDDIFSISLNSLLYTNKYLDNKKARDCVSNP